MPTGYTADVQSGKVTEFDDFVWACARGFGALIEMRDAAHDAPIPDRFQPNTKYYDEKIVEHTARLADLRAMSLPAVREAAQQAHAADLRRSAGWKSEKAEQRSRYEAMLAKVERWTPPTPEHIELKAFMVQQLRESIRFDCSPSRHDEPPPKPEPSEWLAAQIAESERRLASATEERAKEIERTEGRNRWVADLRRSLAEARA